MGLLQVLVKLESSRNLYKNLSLQILPTTILYRLPSTTRRRSTNLRISTRTYP